jgi:PAS domain S-box-containing protein
LEQKQLRDEKRQTEAALRASEQRFRALIENSSDAVALLTGDGTLLYVSPSGSRMFSRSWGERLGRNAFDLMHPDDLPAIKDRFVHLLRVPDTTATVQFRYQHQDDSWRWVEAVGQNLLAEPGVQAVVVNYRDITERKEAEKALRESEERYRSLFENALEGIFRSTPTGRFTHVNPALVRMLGYDSAAEVLSLHLPEELYLDPVQREQLQLSHDPLGKVEGVELRWKKKNGEPMVVMLYAKADRDAQGTISALRGHGARHHRAQAS